MGEQRPFIFIQLACAQALRVDRRFLRLSDAGQAVRLTSPEKKIATWFFMDLGGVFSCR